MLAADPTCQYGLQRGNADSTLGSTTPSFQDGQVLSPSVNLGYDRSAITMSTSVAGDSLEVNYSPVVIEYDHGRIGLGASSLNSIFADPPASSNHFHRHIHSHTFDGVMNGVSSGVAPPSSVSMPQDVGYPSGSDPAYRPLMTSTPLPPPGAMDDSLYAPLLSMATRPVCNTTMPPPGFAPIHNNAGGWSNTFQWATGTSAEVASSTSTPMVTCMSTMDQLQSRIQAEVEVPMDTTNNATADSSLGAIEQMVYNVSYNILLLSYNHACII